MGKNLIQQARGKGSPRYRAPSFRWVGRAKLKSIRQGKSTVEGIVTSFIKCAGHSAPLAQIAYEDGELCLMIAPENIRVGDPVVAAETTDVKTGNILQLGHIPDGTMVYNIENMYGDGGKFCRAGGTFAKVVSHSQEGVVVRLPSKKTKTFNGKCRAAIGIVAGGGRTEKPFGKAGKKYHKMKAKNKLYPRVSGASMNAVDHPFGGSRSSRKGRPTTTSKHAPPGRKVGMVGAKRTGRKKR